MRIIKWVEEFVREMVEAVVLGLLGGAVLLMIVYYCFTDGQAIVEDMLR